MQIMCENNRTNSLKERPVAQAAQHLLSEREQPALHLGRPARRDVDGVGGATTAAAVSKWSLAP